MKYYIIAGEASGDLHASNLMKELRRQDPSAAFRCWGGDLMQEQGGHIVKHIRDLAFMGFWEVLVNLRTILGNFRLCEKDILDYHPDALILVDYPGFNLRMAKFAHEHGIRVIYYISPQLWAWRSSRVKKIRKYVDRMYVILPFEKEFYNRHNYPVDFVGHPLMDIPGLHDPVSFHTSRHEESRSGEKPVIALLPGSRKQEIAVMLKVMLSVVPKFSGYRFVIGAAPSIPAGFYEELAGGSGAGIQYGRTTDLLARSSAALVTSGTATLETALAGVPEVVCYKGNPVSFWIARMIVDVKFISLVNLIMGREVVRELIQHDLTPANLEAELKRILEPSRREEMMQEYGKLRELLGGPGASAKTAAMIIAYLNNH